MLAMPRYLAGGKEEKTRVDFWDKVGFVLSLNIWLLFKIIVKDIFECLICIENHDLFLQNI